MINITLLKQNIKNNYKLFLVFCGILLMYFSIMITMFDPEREDAIRAMMNVLPQEMTNALNFNLLDTTLIGFMASYLYGFLVIMFPMIYIIIVSNRMMAKHVDSGSMAYLLATPNDRKNIALTQLTFLAGSIFLLIAYITVMGYLLAEGFFPGSLDKKIFFDLNLGAFALHFAFGGIGFLASSFFNETKHSLAFGGGIPILFFLISTLANVGGKLENLKYGTILTFYNNADILNQIQGIYLNFSILFAIGFICYTFGVVIFNKKDLSI